MHLIGALVGWVGLQVLPRVAEQLVSMAKAELRRSGGEVRRAGERYVDTVVSNAVLSVRGGLESGARRRQQRHRTTFVVASNEPVNNDNRSNRQPLIDDDHGLCDQYDTRCCFNVRSKANMSQLNLPHGTDN